MASPLEVKVILCDAAVADPSGKVHMLGAGWSVTGSPTSPQAVAVLMKIPWDRANRQIPMALQLFDADGHPAVVSGSEGPKEIKFEGNIEAGRPPGIAHGSLLDSAIALNVPALPLPPGRYQWRLDIGDQTFTESFQVRTQ